MHYFTPPSTRLAYGLLWAFLAFISSSLSGQSLSGYYTLGGTESDFSSFRAAIKKLDSFGISGPVVFKVKDGTYVESDTIRRIKGTSLQNTITFQSESKDSSSVIIEWNSEKTGDWNLWLHNTSFITFKHIGFRQLYDGARQNVNIVRGHNITFENCLFEGSNLVMDGCLLSGTIDSNLRVTHCTFRYARKGISLKTSGKKSSENLLINSNKFHTQNMGLYLRNIDHATIANNTFLNITGGLYSGVNLGELKSLKVSANLFVVNANTPNTRAIDLSDIFGNKNSRSVLSNNIVKIETSGAKNVHAIRIGRIDSCVITNNNFQLKSEDQESSVVLFRSSENARSLFVNNIVSNVGSGYAYSVHSTSLSGIEIDYNLWYTTSGKINPVYSSLAELITADSSNSHSLFGDPLFADSDTLLATSPFIDSNAVKLPEVSSDFLDVKRNNTYPDIGATEKLHLPYLKLPEDTTGCGKLTLQAITNGSWLTWSDASHKDSIVISSSGIYHLTAYNGDGKVFASTKVTILQPQPFSIQANPDSSQPSACISLSTSLLAGDLNSIVWRDTSGIIKIGSHVSVCPQHYPATYFAEYINADGCISKDSIVILQPLGIGGLLVYKNGGNNSANHHTDQETTANNINNLVSQSSPSTLLDIDNIEVYPNPTRTKLNISLLQVPSTKCNIYIYDIAGTPVWTGLWQPQAYEIDIDVADLPAGTYTFHITDGSVDYKYPFVKMFN